MSLSIASAIVLSVGQERKNDRAQKFVGESLFTQRRNNETKRFVRAQSSSTFVFRLRIIGGLIIATPGSIMAITG